MKHNMSAQEKQTFFACNLHQRGLISAAIRDMIVNAKVSHDTIEFMVDCASGLVKLDDINIALVTMLSRNK